MERKDTTSSSGDGCSGKMQDWSVDQVCQWLADLQCDSEVIDEFQRHKISGFALSRLEEKHLDKMKHVMIGDQVTIINKRNEVLQKEALETSPKDCTSVSQTEKAEAAISYSKVVNIPSQNDATVSVCVSEFVLQNPAEQTNKPQEGSTNLEFAQVFNNQNDTTQVHSSFPSETKETKLNTSINLPISADIADTSYQTQTSFHKTDETNQNQKDLEEENINHLVICSSATDQIPVVVRWPAEVISGDGVSVDNMPSEVTKSSTSNENVILSESCSNNQFQNFCIGHVLGLQEHVPDSDIELISVRSNLTTETSLTEQCIDTHLLQESPGSSSTFSISGSVTLKENNAGEYRLSEDVDIEKVLLGSKEHSAMCGDIPKSSFKAEMESEQSMQLASGTEFTSRFGQDSFSDEKMSHCEHLAALLKEIQIDTENVSDEQDTKTIQEITDRVLDTKQMNAKSGMSDYETLTEIYKFDGNTNMTEGQNLCASTSNESIICDKIGMCEVGKTLTDSDKTAKDDVKLSECEHKQISENKLHAPESVPDESPRHTLASSGDIPKGSARRFKNVKELIEFKKQKQQQSSQSHLKPSLCSQPTPTMPEEECLIPQIPDKSEQNASDFQMLLSKEKNMLSQLTETNKNPVVGQGNLSLKGTELFKDQSLKIKGQNFPKLVEKKESVSQMHATCMRIKAETTVEPEKSTEQFKMDCRKSVGTLDSRKLEPQFVEAHYCTTKAVQSKDAVPLSTTADTSPLMQEQMGSECTHRPVPAQSSCSTAKKEPFSMKKSPKSTSSSNAPATYQPAPVSAAVSDQKKSSVKLIGKNAPQNESKAKFLRNTLALAETNVIKANQLPAEVLRKIGSRTDVKFKYRQGAKISACDRHSGQNLLHPVHRFALFESLKDVTSLIEFCKEVIQFACACLNDRTNGIIHFGIESESRNSIAVYGNIVGVALHREPREYEDFLRKAISKSFNEAQAEAALQCIQEPEFIETVPNDIPQHVPQQTKLFVIEVDVIPKHKFCKDEMFCVTLPTKQKGCFEPESTFRLIDASPCKLNPGDQHQFRMKVALLAAERKELEEQSKKKQKIENGLSKKFINLFCHGSENLLGDHYHILVVNKPDDHMDVEYMDKALSFIADIEWKVVFDFDAEASLCNFVQEKEKPIKIKMADDFYHRSKYNIKEPDRLKQMHDDLKNSDCPTWVFANGYQPQNEDPQPPREWKKNRAEGFKYAVRFFRDQIPQGRATVLFLLLSKETEVMLLAADELMTIFYNQWMCVAESEDIGKPWIDELVRRDSAEPENAETNVVWGMPWKHVQETVTRLLGPKKYSVCELPTSTGAYIPLNNTMNNELTDLEILGSFECDNAEIQYDEEQLRQHKKQVEEEFYKGNSVSWWNFWFHQVCVRDILEPAKRSVQSALCYDEETVGKVFLYHQPGAGATTLATNILWDFRKEYRCAVVRKISGGQTAGQVLKLFWYEDNNPKPVLLILDNPDADKLNLLYADLSEMTRCIIRTNDEVPRVVCVLLVCSRIRTTVVNPDPQRLLLKHELSRRELNWFQDRYKYLSAEFANLDSDIRPPNTVHPRLLISFNVMKENFNPEYIRRTVRELVQTITEKKEKKLLKYVSLLNSFDLECRPIPTSSLDGMMLEIPWTNQSGLR